MHSTSGNFEDDNTKVIENETLTNIDSVEQNEVTPSHSQEYMYHSQKSKKNTKEMITPFQNKLVTLLEQSVNDDPDKQFLLSLLPDYKKLNDSQKLDFRITSLNFFKNAQQSHNSNSLNIQHNLYHNDNLYQNSPTFNLPPHRQLEINNTFYHPNTSHNIPSFPSPYSQPVVYTPPLHTSSSQYPQVPSHTFSNETSSLTNIVCSNSQPNTSQNK